MIVEEVMTRNPICAKPNDTISSVLEKFDEADVRHLPVVEEGNLVGMISDRDVHEIALRRAGSDPMDTSLAKALEGPAADYMASDVASVDTETDLGEAIDTLLDRRVGALPVVEVDSTKVVGILSYVDVLRALRSFVE